MPTDNPADESVPINPALLAPPPTAPRLYGGPKGGVGTVSNGGPDVLGGLGKLFGGASDFLFGGQPSEDEQQQRASQWYEQYRAGDHPLPAPDWLRRLMAAPPVNQPHPELPGYHELNDEGQQAVLKSYRDYVNQMTRGQAGVFQNFPGPQELGLRGAGEAINATPAKPILQAGVEAKNRELYVLGKHTEDPPYERATEAQRQAAYGSANQLLLLLGVRPETTVGLQEGSGAVLRQLAMLGRQASPFGVGETLGGGAQAGVDAFAREAGARRPAPWELTRSEFYAPTDANQFHGSYQNPMAGREASEAGSRFGDYAGFFTTEDPNYAAYYGTLQDQEPAAAAALDKVYRTSPGTGFNTPAHPLDMINDRAGIEQLLQVYRDAYDRAAPLAKTPDQLAALREWAGDLSNLSQLERRPDLLNEQGQMDAWALVDAFSNMAINRARVLGQEHPTEAEGGPSPDTDNRFFNQALRQLGYDAFTRTETNPETGQQAAVTAWLDRPIAATTHRIEVERALQQGKDVSEDVLKDYPDLQTRYRPVPGTPAFVSKLATSPLRPPPPEMDLTHGVIAQAIARQEGVTAQQYDIVGATGKPIGDLLFTIQRDGVAHVHWIGVSGGANELGVGDIRRLVVAIKQLHPEITGFTGYRVSGSRGGEGPHGGATQTLQLHEGTERPVVERSSGLTPEGRYPDVPAPAAGTTYPIAGAVNPEVAAHPERYEQGAPPPGTATAHYNAEAHRIEYGPDDRLYALPIPIRPQDIKVLADVLARVLKPFGIGGRVQRASELARQLSQFTPDAAQQLAARHVDLLSNELGELYGTGPDPAGPRGTLADRERAIRERANTLGAAGRDERAAAEHARADELARQRQVKLEEWQKAVADKTNEIGKYETAMRDVVDGRGHPTTVWADQIANEIHDKIGFSETELPPGPHSGFMLARSEANMLLKKSRGLQTAVNNLVTSWSRALVKALPKREDRRRVMYAMEPERLGQPATLHGPIRPGEEIPPGPNRQTDMVHLPEPGPRPIPDVIQRIMDEEYQVPGGETLHLNEEQAYAAARARGLWPTPESTGIRPEEAPVTGPPPAGQVLLHGVRASTPPPVELTPEIYAAAGAIRALLARVGLHLVDNAHLVAALREDFYPHIFLRGPNGETAAEAMNVALNPGRRHPLNPDSPHFHRRFIEETLHTLKSEGYEMVDDPAILVPAYLRSVTKALANQMVTTYIRGAIVRPGQDGRPAFVPGVQARRPTTAFGMDDYRYINTQELKGWLHPDVYNAIRWQLEPPRIQAGILKGGEVKIPGEVPGVGGKTVKLPGIIQWQQAVRQIAMWNPLFHGENQLSHHLMTSMVPARLALLGRAMSQDPAILRDAGRWAHLVPSHSALNDMIDIVQGIMPEIRDPLGMGNLSSIPGRVNDWRHRVLWEGMVRNAQVAAFVLERDRLMARGFSREEASAGAGVYADRIVGAQDPATKLRWERIGTRYFMFAWNWTKTHVMQVGESMPWLGERVLMKEHPFLAPEVAAQLSTDLLLSTVRGVASSLVYTQLLNLMLTGLEGDPRLTFFNEKGREFSLDVTWVAERMGIPTGGKRVYLASPFMRFFDWYRQYLDDIQRANGGHGGIGSGTAEFLKNKLMAPFPEVWDQITHAESGGVQWSDWDRVKHALSGGALGTGGILPTNVVGRPADLVAAIQELLPHGPVDLLDPSAVWARMTSPGLATGRQELALAARIAGMNPPSYGPRADVGQVLDPDQQRRADVWLVDHGISPVKASPEQRDEAIVAVGNEVFDQGNAREQKYQDVEKQAVIEELRRAGIPDAEQAYDTAVKEGGSPYDELNSLQKAEVFKNHPELELYHQVSSGNADPEERDVLRQSTAYRVRLQDQIDAERQAQRDDDALFMAGKMSEFAWRDRRSRRLQELYGENGAQASLQAAYPQALITRQQWDEHLAKFGRAPRGVTEEDTAYEQYRAIQLDAPQYQLPDGTPDVLRWWQDRQQVLRGLPYDEQTFIHAKEAENRTPLENLYQQASNKYLAFEAQHAAAAQAYHQLYQQTNSPQQRQLLEAMNPALQGYIVQRKLFFMQHPAIAFFFLHGRQAAVDLAMAGVSPYATPAQQLSQLDETGALDELTQSIIGQGNAASP